MDDLRFFLASDDEAPAPRIDCKSRTEKADPFAGLPGKAGAD